MSFMQEFKDFAMKGNVVDLAVGVIIGAAFGKIVSSLVADVFMPVIGLVVGGINFSDMGLKLKDAIDKDHPAVILAYGKFLQATFDFIIVALVIFVVIKAMNSMKKKQAAAPPAAPPAQEVLLTEIRDLLKTRA